MPNRRPMRALAALASATLALGLAACAPTSTSGVELPSVVDAALPDELTGQLRAAVETAVAATGASGAIVDVQAPWSGGWREAIGSVSPGGAAATVDTPFKAGDVTQSMTCDVLYGMVHEGKVALDDAVVEWLPGYPTDPEITLAQLCDGTSGLQAYAPMLGARFSAVPERDWNPRELAAYGFSRGLAAAPGTTYTGSDTEYVLLGLVLERASGLSAADLYERYVFEPTAMESSSLPDADASTDGRLAGLLTPVVDGAAQCDAPADMTTLSSSTGYTSSGVVSTVGDLSRYIRAVAAGARPYDAAGRFETPISLGDPSWFTAKGGDFQAGSLVGQYGSTPGYLTAAFADRETGLSVVVVLNNSLAADTVVRSLAWQLAALASKAPAASGQTAPEAGLPWDAEGQGQQVVAGAVCPIP
ncbi:serine hydrolase domain-containing protein [Microbacterium telephonicum]|uniref:D-alanyl-D-alanine carboxypeptidase n=1 Tax=Microbacterium telephonicum TaxID=1714841 RepID=A0A498C868_9MICO|nr:serine hydrolase domain-containing protein [Microbacterium telephonicum]RLK52085.1 D-alanyl-D-alanine carboxypeptidase [Microbacterium telephonicum]